jgi:ABC-type multidrug transport system fused ATPase/permease subunit
MIRTLLKIFSIFDKNQKKSFFIIQFLIIINSLLEVCSLFLVGQFVFLLTNIENLRTKEHFNIIYNFFHFSNDKVFFIFLSIIILTFFLVSTVFSILTIRMLSMYGSKLGAEISIRLYKYFINQNWIFYTKKNSNILINKISLEAERVNSGIIQPFMHMNSKFVLSFLITFSILIYDFFSTLSGLLVFLISYFILYKTVQKKLYYYGQVISETQSLRLKILSETFGSIKEILLYNRKKYFQKCYENECQKYSRAYGITQVLIAMPRYIIELIAISFLSLLMIILTLNYDKDIVDLLPFLTIFGFATLKLLPSLQTIYIGISSIKANISAFENIQNEIAKNIIEKKDSDLNKRDKLILKKKIILKNISYKYVKNIDVLRNISIDINNNTTVGLAGPSGCGKSTLADIIMGLIKPSHGKIFFDGKEILKNNEQKRKWQNSIGYVSHSTYLVDATILENIFFGLNKESIDFEKLKKCLKISNLNKFIEELPNGINTIVGEKGIQLSGGQKQRIGIARALYDDINFLVFDEATSSLDGISEKKIMDAIKNFSGQKTILIIAHRISTLKNCDIIYFMNNGKIVDRGNYDYLINKNKLFQKMSQNYK